MDVLVKETQWQKHSVRGFLAGTVRKKLKLSLLSEKIDGVRTYRIGTAKASKPAKKSAHLPNVFSSARVPPIWSLHV